MNCVGLHNVSQTKRLLEYIIHNYSCQFLKKMQFLVFFLAGIKNNETRND